MIHADAAPAAAFLASAAVRATLVLLAACAADVALRRRASAAARHLAWTLAVAALLLIPVLTPILPRWSVAVPTPRPVFAATDAAAANRPAPDLVRRTDDAAPSVAVDPAVLSTSHSRSVSPVAASAGVDWGSVAIALYLAGVAAMLVRLGMQRRSLLRLARGAQVLREDGWRADVSRISRRLGISRPVTILQAPRGLTPMTWGTLRPTILVPADAAEWPDERRDAVLMHELAHVARLDCLTQTLAAVACVLYWFHPGAWWAARRLRDEREHACDDRVLAAGAGACGYARELLEIARTLSIVRQPAMAVSMAATRGQLEARLRALVDPLRVRTVPRWPARIAAVGVAAVLAAGVSAAQVGTPALPGIAAAGGQRTVSAAGPIRAEGSRQATISPERPIQATGTGAASISPERPIAASFDAQEGTTGAWSIEPAEHGAGDLQLTLIDGDNMHGNTVPRSRFEGLPPNAFTARSLPAHFQVRGESGAIDFTGTFADGRGTGQYRFTPAAGFASAWSRRGVEAPDTDEMLRLTISGATLAGLDAYLREVHVRPATETLVRFFTHDIPTAYIRELASVGFGQIEGEEIIRLHNHGVDAATVRELRSVGLADINPESVIRLRNHDVDVQFIREIQAAGYPHPDAEELVYLHNHGITADQVRRANAEAGTHLDLNEIARARHRHRD